MEAKTKNKWYQSTVAIIALLIFFFPAGLFLMWKYTNWNKKAKWVITGFFGLMLLGSAISGNSTNSKTTETSNTTTPAQQATTASNQPTSPPKPTNTPAPTATPVPTDANGFPMDYETVTVAQIAKVPSSYADKKLMFTCNVLSFAKNSQGDAAAINCTDPNDYSAIIQVGGSFFDFTKINQGDTVRLYGTGGGASTGKNAFGADVTEGLVDGELINDLTTGYKNNY